MDYAYMCIPHHSFYYQTLIFAIDFDEDLWLLNEMEKKYTAD